MGGRASSSMKSIGSKSYGHNSQLNYYKNEISARVKPGTYRYNISPYEDYEQEIAFAKKQLSSKDSITVKNAKISLEVLNSKEIKDHVEEQQKIFRQNGNRRLHSKAMSGVLSLD